MSISSIGSSMPTPKEPERSKTGKATPEKSSAAPRAGEAATTKGLVSQIGARMIELNENQERIDDRVRAVLEEMDRGELLNRASIEHAAESMLFGEDPEAIPLD